MRRDRVGLRWDIVSYFAKLSGYCNAYIQGNYKVTKRLNQIVRLFGDATFTHLFQIIDIKRLIILISTLCITLDIEIRSQSKTTMSVQLLAHNFKISWDYRVEKYVKFGGIMDNLQNQVYYENGNFISIDGIRLYEQSWCPKSDKKGVIIIVHGYLEHSSRYTHVAEFFASHGYAVETYDHRGHGKSEGQKAFFNSFDELVKDMHRFVIRVCDRHPNTPVFIFGHSMGGTVVTMYTIQYNPIIKGILLSGAALIRGDSLSPFMVLLASIIGWIIPTLPTIQPEPSLISRSPDIVKSYETDPLILHAGSPARSISEILATTKIIQKNMEAINLPLLIMHGLDDRIVDVKGSQLLYETSKSVDKTLLLYENLYHELVNEPERLKVMNDMKEWLDKRL